MRIKVFITLFLTLLPALSSANTANIWASIPFIRGADLCRYNQAYSQTRSEYMYNMMSLASDVMDAGGRGRTSLRLLLAFDALYDKNIRLGASHRYMDVTLENTFKSYLDSFYNTYPVKERKIQFKHMRRLPNNPNEMDDTQIVDYVAYGSYSLAPNCNGNVQVTLSLVGKDGTTMNFEGTDRPSVVMSKLAARVFEKFQRTQFPSTLSMNGKSITLLGSPNGRIGDTFDPRDAMRTCRYMGGRLPNSTELEIVSAFGDWNGGIAIGKKIWAIAQGQQAMIYHPGLRNPSPVRRMTEVNTRDFKYYCVQ